MSACQITTTTKPDESVTLVQAPGRRLAKLIRKDGSQVGYDRVRTVDLREMPVADLAALHRALIRLQHQQDSAIIRGKPIDPARTARVRRLLHTDQQAGDAATLHEVPRRWLALDVDSLPAPAGIDLHDLSACGRAALAALPAPFHGAAVIVQATASHTFKPGLRLRLWCWLSRPMVGAELKRWLGETPVDPSIFGAAQLIYTAAPIFIGLPDPLSVRLVLLSGLPEVTPPVLPATQACAVASAPCRLHTSARPNPWLPGVPLKLRIAGARRYRATVLRASLGRVLAAPARHPALVAEAVRLMRLMRAGVFVEAEVQAVIHAAARCVGKTDLREIDSLIAWARAVQATNSSEATDE